MIKLIASCQIYYNYWTKSRIINRILLSLYFFIDKRFIVIYILPFFGLITFNKFLKFLGKNI